MLFSKPQAPQSPRDSAARTQRRFVGRSLQGITLLLGGLAIVNLMVDPFRCFPRTRRASWSGQSQLLGSRTAKAELAFAESWEVAMVGSSRVEIGLDPQARCWRGRQVCNLGLTATSMREVRRVVERVTANASLDEIILALDFSLFNEQRPCGADFRQSRFDPACGIVENRLEMLWGWRATEESWAIISGAARKPPRIRADGFYQRDPASVTADRQRAAFELELLHFASWPQLYGDFRYTGASLHELAEALEVCRDRGVDVKVVILPVHGLLLEVIQRAGLWPTLETWKRDVTRLVQQTWDTSPRPPVYDFTSYQGACAERLPRGAAAMRWFWEASHFRAELGSLVVERVLEGGVDTDTDNQTLVPMRMLNVDNIDHQLAAIRAGRPAFLKACEDDLDLARRAVGQSLKTPLAQWQP